MLLTLIGVLILLALGYYVLTALPLPPMVKTIGTVILVVIVVLWLVQTFIPGANFLK